MLQMLCFLLLMLSSVLAAKCPNNCTVLLPLGAIKGNCDYATYDAYTNIPYAKPPLGELRFEPPQPLQTAWNGILAANKPAVRCVEFRQSNPTVVGTEDCLCVNVYVPKRNGIHPKPLMVMVYFHPGGFQIGTPTNDPAKMMSDGEFILVTISYRLGPLGFLSTLSKELPGNMGLKDQRMAIQWVEQNIAAFGGDAARILLLGNSAGGSSVELHMLLGNTNAKAFAALSGSMLNNWAFDINPLPNAQDFAQLMQCPFDDRLKQCLQNKTVNEIWPTYTKMFKYYGFSTGLFLPTLEAEDIPHAILTQTPEQLIKTANIAKDTPFLIGAVKGEGTDSAAEFALINSNGTEAIHELNDNWLFACPLMFFFEHYSPAEQEKLCNDMKERYMCNMSFSMKTYRLLENMFTDNYFEVDMNKSIEYHLQAGRNRIYRYEADLPQRYSIGNLISDRWDLCFGSVHTADMFFMLPENEYPPVYLSESEKIKEETVLKSLLNLLKSLVEDGPPKYQDIVLKPIELTPTDDDCLFISFEKYFTKKCGMERNTCSNLGTLQCEAS